MTRTTIFLFLLAGCRPESIDARHSLLGDSECESCATEPVQADPTCELCSDCSTSFCRRIQPWQLRPWQKGLFGQMLSDGDQIDVVVDLHDNGTPDEYSDDTVSTSMLLNGSVQISISGGPDDTDGEWPLNVDSPYFQQITTVEDEPHPCTSDGTPHCGDGAVQEPEQCDGADFAGQDCRTFGFASGMLACNDSCEVNLDACVAHVPSCGDGVADWGELCDGADLFDLGCADFGFDDGSLACQSDCHGFDTSGCTTAQARARISANAGPPAPVPAAEPPPPAAPQRGIFPFPGSQANVDNVDVGSWMRDGVAMGREIWPQAIALNYQDMDALIRDFKEWAKTTPTLTDREKTFVDREWRPSGVVGNLFTEGIPAVTWHDQMRHCVPWALYNMERLHREGAREIAIPTFSQGGISGPTTVDYLLQQDRRINPGGRELRLRELPIRFVLDSTPVQFWRAEGDAHFLARFHRGFGEGNVSVVMTRPHDVAAQATSILGNIFAAAFHSPSGPLPFPALVLDMQRGEGFHGIENTQKGFKAYLDAHTGLRDALQRAAGDPGVRVPGSAHIWTVGNEGMIQNRTIKLETLAQLHTIAGLHDPAALERYRQANRGNLAGLPASDQRLVNHYLDYVHTRIQQHMAPGGTRPPAPVPPTRPNARPR